MFMQKEHCSKRCGWPNVARKTIVRREQAQVQPVVARAATKPTLAVVL